MDLCRASTNGRFYSRNLHEAVERNDLALARALLAARPDLHARDATFHATPLDWAKHLRRTEMITLIERRQHRQEGA